MMNWINKKRNKKGFTLVELVVVIAILGILAAIAVPKFTDQTAKAKENAQKATARTIASAVSMAIAEKTETGNPDAGEINKYLSNLTVTVQSTEPDTTDTGWFVVFTGDGFDIYDGNEKIEYL